MKKEKTITVRRQKIQPDRTKKRLCFFLFLTALLLLTVVFAEQICPYDPNAQDTGAALLPPGAGHLAGTDRFGRDMLSRILVGLKTSVTSTLILVVVVTVTGSIWGCLRIFRRNCRHRYYADFRYLSCVSRTGFCNGNRSSFKWRNQ